MVGIRRAVTLSLAVFLALAALPLASAYASGSVITTLAGTGTAGDTGDGGPATAAELSAPAGISVDSSGDVFVADEGANVVREITPAGVISTVAGTGTAGYTGDGGPATAAELKFPTDVTLGSDGSLYIADFGNHVVRRVLPSGIITTFAGTGTAGYSGDGGLATSAQLASPDGLALASGTGTLYISDWGNGTVRAVSPLGIISTVAGTGQPGFSGDGGPATSAQLSFPADIWDRSGGLYVSDVGNRRVRQILADGTITTVAGTGAWGSSGDGGPATAAALMIPTGIAIDSSGDLYIADSGANVIRMVAPDGTISTVAGTGTGGYSGDGGPPTSAMLRTPARLSIDLSGNLLVADLGNHRIRAISGFPPVGVPGAPTGVSATAGDAQATVSWSAPASDGGSPITGYTVTASDGTQVAAGPGATSATVTGLSNGTSYTFTVTATNTAGTGPASSPSNAVTPQAPVTVPGAPTGVSAVAGDAQATVSWTAPASDGGSPITGYTVTASDGTTVAAGPAATSATVSGLTNGTSYTFTVAATNAVGTGPASGPSNAVTPQAPATVPGAPTGVSAVAGDGQANVSWSPPASDGGSAITGYTVTASDGTTVSAGAAATSATVTGLTNGTSYTFTVAATNAAGTGPASGPSNAVTPQAPVTVPGAPTGVSATAGDGQATVSWSPPASDGGSAITGYTVTASDGTTVSAGAGATSATVSGLTNGTSYTFTVAATNTVGTGAASVPSNAVTPQAPVTVPGAPTGVSATAGDGQATVSWTAPASDGGSAITGYTVTASDGTTVAAGPAATSATVTGLTNGTSYTFTVSATNTAGASPASAPSNAITPQPPAPQGGGGTPPPPTVTAPSAPQHVTATKGDGSATVTWDTPASDGGSPVTGYVVTASHGSTTVTVTVDGHARTAMLSGLVNGTSYAITVVATNSSGSSAPAETSVTPKAPRTNGSGGGGEIVVPPAGDGGSPSDQGQTGSAGSAGGATNPSAAGPAAPVSSSGAGGALFTSTVQHFSVPAAHHHHARHRHHHRAAAPAPSQVVVPAHRPQLPPTKHAHHGSSVLQTIARAALTVSKNTAIPVGLLALIGLFLLVQNRLDRSDPKLALAPVYGDPGVSFVPAMS